MTIAAILLWVGMPGPDTTQYTRYETEDVSRYRVVVPFEYPEVEGVKATTGITQDLPLTGGDEHLKVDAPAALDELIIRAKEQGATQKLEGFRVQIYSGGDLEEANKIRADFLQLHEEQAAYRLWVQPTFRVRVGDFPTRNDAVLFANEIKKDFPGAFVVPDKIEKPRIRKNETKEELVPEEEGEEPAQPEGE